MLDSAALASCFSLGTLCLPRLGGTLVAIFAGGVGSPLSRELAFSDELQQFKNEKSLKPPFFFSDAFSSFISVCAGIGGTGSVVVFASACARLDRLLLDLLDSRFFFRRLFFEPRSKLPASSIAVVPVKAVDSVGLLSLWFEEDRDGTLNKDRFFFGFSDDPDVVGSPASGASFLVSTGSLPAFGYFWNDEVLMGGRGEVSLIAMPKVSDWKPPPDQRYTCELQNDSSIMAYLMKTDLPVGGQEG